MKDGLKQESRVQKMSVLRIIASWRFVIINIIGLRLVQAVLTVLGASVLIWSLLPLTPGDPALRLLQARGIEVPLPQEIEAVRREWGMDRPLPIQYIQWLLRALHGDLSNSFQSGKPVLGELGRRLPGTIMLAGTALIISLVLSITAALIASAYQERWPDQLIRVLTQVGATTPSFLLGLLIIYFLVLKLGLGHVISRGQLKQVWLPALCLAVGQSATWTQLLRANLLEVLGRRYTLVATARGATRLRVLLFYALPNAALPFFTAVGVGIGALLGGAPIIEVIFSWPGIGSYVVESIAARDMPVIQGFVIISTIIYVVMSFLVDILAGLMDSRIRTRNGI